MTERSAAPTRFDYPARDGVDIVAYRWLPETLARGVVQLTHGMGEHLLRYAPLAAELTARGYVVVGQDHRGHGATGGSAGNLGELGPHGWSELVNDIDLLVTKVHAVHPDLPLVLLGHSMGSFAVQQYLIDHSDRVSAVVLSGTCALDLLEPGLDLEQQLDPAVFNHPFVPARTDSDWLSRDEAQVDAYIADPLCGFGLDVAGIKALFAGARALAEPGRLSGVRPGLPIYIAVGDADPVTDRLAFVHPLIERYRAAGLMDVALKAYAGARHEVFNETNRHEVVADLLAWLEGAVRR